MKIVSRIVSLAVIACVLMVFSNCGSDGAATPPEKIQLEKLSKTWTLTNATLGGAPRFADFTGFNLTISGSFNKTTPEGPYNYSVTGSRPTPSPWAANGTWSFSNIGSGDTGSLLRNDGVPMVYAISSGGQLTISDLICDKIICNYPGARAGQVEGNWVFTFN